jgi:hypothetical protein
LKSLLTLKKNYKHDLKDKIKNYKIFEKKARDKNKKFKVEGPNKKLLYIQIKNQELNCKKTFTKGKITKLLKSKLKGPNLKY